MNKPVALNAALSSRPVAASQSTSIEQSRAIAEVQSMVVVAQNCPRNEAQAIQKMREACGRLALAEMAFFKFPRGGATVQGPSVHLARELARCWGNINYGVSELDRDDLGGKSEMVAYAWDVQTNARSATAFIVPHKRDKKGGAETLVDMRDIYENNANNAARRLREMVFSVLPKWYVEEAKQLCRLTLEKGEGDKPLTQRIADAISALEKLGISTERIEAKIGAKSAAWTPVDIANLAVSFRSIKNKEVSAEDEFPTLGAVKLEDALKAPIVGTVDVDEEQRSSEGAQSATPTDRHVAKSGSNPGPRSTEAEALIDTGSAAESASTLARLLSVLPDLPDVAALAEWKASVANERASLTPEHAGEFNTAFIEREKRLAAKVRK